MVAQVTLQRASWQPAACVRCRGSRRSAARVMAAAQPEPPPAPPGPASGSSNGNGSASNGVKDVGKSTNICWHETMVTRSHKELLLGQRGCVLWFTGLSGSGKSTVACTLEHLLHESGHFTVLLDGDNIRHGLNNDLGFSAEDRTENIRRIGEVAKLFADSGTLCLTSFISPYRADREAVRARCRPGEFLEVLMDVPLEVCEARDPKGLYAKARAGLIKNFTGIDDPYEAPDAPEFRVACYSQDGQARGPREMAEEIFRQLKDMGYLRDPAMPTLAVANALQRKHSDGILDFSSL